MTTRFVRFKQESAKFACALQAEHRALGALLEQLDDAVEKVYSPKPEWVAAAREAHAAVDHQRLRTEAARGA